MDEKPSSAMDLISNSTDDGYDHDAHFRSERELFALEDETPTAEESCPYPLNKSRSSISNESCPPLSDGSCPSPSNGPCSPISNRSNSFGEDDQIIFKAEILEDLLSVLYQMKTTDEKYESVIASLKQALVDTSIPRGDRRITWSVELIDSTLKCYGTFWDGPLQVTLKLAQNNFSSP